MSYDNVHGIISKLFTDLFVKHSLNSRIEVVCTFLSDLERNSSNVLKGKDFEGYAKYDIIKASQSQYSNIPAARIVKYEILLDMVLYRSTPPNIKMDL